MNQINISILLTLNEASDLNFDEIIFKSISILLVLNVDNRKKKHFNKLTILSIQSV